MTNAEEQHMGHVSRFLRRWVKQRTEIPKGMGQTRAGIPKPKLSDIPKRRPAPHPNFCLPLKTVASKGKFVKRETYDTAAERLIESLRVLGWYVCELSENVVRTGKYYEAVQGDERIVFKPRGGISYLKGSGTMSAVYVDIRGLSFAAFWREIERQQ